MPYWICRHYADGRPSELVKKVRSLYAAQDHCNDPKTQKAGKWFDGYTDKKPLCAENPIRLHESVSNKTFVDFSPRRGGKTTRMIEWLREDEERVMLTFDPFERMRLQQTYPDVAGRIFTWESWVRDNHWRINTDFTQVGVDNADLILSRMARAHINRMTISET